MTSKPCAAVLFIAFLGMVAASCSTDATNGDDTPSDASCVPLPESEGLGWEVSAQTLSSKGSQLTYVRRVVAVGDDGSSTQSETTIEADGKPVMLITEESSPTRYEIVIAYGALVPGLTMATAVVEDEVLTGFVNDRAIVPILLNQEDPPAPRFEDGGVEPDPGVDPDIGAALPGLLENARDNAQNCGQPSDAAGRVVGKRGDTGHVSLPAFSEGCLTCKGVCSGGLLACNISAAAGCIAATLWYAVCLASSEAACFTTYAVCIFACKQDGEPCCPVGCGDGCCEEGETCINESQQLCCGTNQFDCLGRECCDNTEVCIDGGPNAGTCCNPGDRCVDACCSSGDNCLPMVSMCCAPDTTPCVDKCCEEAGCIEGPNSGTCCEPRNMCGNICCSDLDSCIHFQDGTGLCCGFATPACGNKCCGAAETCLGGGNCCPSERVCVGSCCPQGSACNLQTNKCQSCPDPNEKYCSASDSCCATTEVCTPVADLCCPAGQMYCGLPLACRPAAECLR